MDVEKKAQKHTPRPRPIAAFILRAFQVVFCVICLATSCHWAKTWAPFRTSGFQVYLILQSVNFSIFISVTGALLSAFLVFAPRVVPQIADDLPGLVDLVLSAIWSIFFLSMGASLASWGACKSSSLCMAWNGTIGMGFLLFLLYGASAVLAALDLRDQLRALNDQIIPVAAPPAPTPIQAKKAPSVSSSNGGSPNARSAAQISTRPSTPDQQV